jgi:hypothetical protein
MLINTSLSTETAARDLRNSRAADSTPAPAGAALQPPGPDSAMGRLRGLAPLDEEGVSGITDASGADQAAGFIRANLSSQHGLALAAQANLDPESAYNLLT